jgi:hypothetical protein
MTRSGDPDAPSSVTPSSSQTAAQPTTTIGVQTELVARLREILEVRDRALSVRNPDLLSDIYTIDCKCLKDGRALIATLRKEAVVWKGVRTSLAVRDIEEVNDRLWIIIADVTTPSVRIETESGRLIRMVPPERNRVRFALAKPVNENEWLLGHASAFD